MSTNEIDVVVQIITAQIEHALDKSRHGESNPLSFVLGELISDDECLDEYRTYEADFFFKYGNLERKHSALIGWNDSGEVGFEYGEDGDLTYISYGSVMSHLYFDLAMDGIAEEFMI